METLKYNTSLKCNGCLAAVKPGLDGIKGIKEWSVDLTSPERTLTAQVESGDVAKDIIEVFEKAGHKAWI